MSGIAVAIGGTAILGTLGAAGVFGDGGGGSVGDINLPDWEEDPLYKKSQESLDVFGQDLLGGKLPDFYSTLGKTNTPEFQNILALINRDTSKAVNENLVRRNISRSGVGLSTTAKAVADASTKLRWEDFLRANNEKAGLLNTGLNTVSGVRNSALDWTNSKNAFNLNKVKIALGQAEAIDAQAAAKDAAWGDILGSSIGAAGMYFGMQGLGSAGTLGTSGVSGGLKGYQSYNTITPNSLITV